MKQSKLEISYGQHTVRHALEQTPDNILELFIQKDKKNSAVQEKLVELAVKSGISVQRVSRDVLDKQTGNALHQGVVIKRRASTTEHMPTLDDVLSKKEGALFLLVLEGIQDPHNMGACLRTANAVGVDAVILAKDNTVSINSTVSKVASGGAENTIIITVSNIARTLRQLKDAGVWIVGTAADVDSSIYEIDLTVSTAIIMGNEGKGLRKNTRDHCDHLVSLPMHGVVESLNVSVASAVCLYEVLRQRRIK